MPNESQKCEECQNVLICKYSNEMCRIDDEVLKISKASPTTIIRINITCDRFIRKNKKQDGFRA